MSPSCKRDRLYISLTDPEYSRRSYFLVRYFDLLCLVSLIAMTCETVNTWRYPAGLAKFWFALESIISIQLILKAMIKFICVPKIYTRSWSFLVDVLSILPYPFEVWLFTMWDQRPAATGWLRLTRILRLARLFQFHPLIVQPDLQPFLKALRRSRPAFLYLAIYNGLGLFSFAWAIFLAETSFCEVDASGFRWLKPKAVPCPLQNMFESLWMCLCTLVTVGYGDYVPASPPAKLLASLLMVFSLVSMPLGAAIFGANLTELYLEARMARKEQRLLHNGSSIVAGNNETTVSLDRSCQVAFEREIGLATAEYHARILHLHKKY
jgi:voltage-gated potassium channel